MSFAFTGGSLHCSLALDQRVMAAKPPFAILVGPNLARLDQLEEAMPADAELGCGVFRAVCEFLAGFIHR